MKTTFNIYHGIVNEAVKTESFRISISNHEAKSDICAHTHDKSYIALSVCGDYREKSFCEELVMQGEVIYRTAGHEHANSFFDKNGVCLNIEFNDEEQLLLENELNLPIGSKKQRSSIDFYKVLLGFKNGVANDALNIYCYEAMLSFCDDAKKGDLAWINQVKDRLNDAPFETVSLTRLSSDFGLHPNYIARKFKEVVGVKLSDYLAQTRLQYSLQDLLGTGHNLTEIALKCGYYDQSHFNRAFKKELSTTPSLFKKIVKG